MCGVEVRHSKKYFVIKVKRQPQKCVYDGINFCFTMPFSSISDYEEFYKNTLNCVVFD